MSDKKPQQPHVLMEVGGLVDETEVCLAVYGPELDPDDVTKWMGCAPTRSHRSVDPRRAAGSPPQPSGAWLLELRGWAPTGPEQLRRRLLTKVQRDPSVWEALAEQYDVQLRLGIHFTGWNKGFDIPREAVRGVAELRASLVLDVYGHGDDADA